MPLDTWFFDGLLDHLPCLPVDPGPLIFIHEVFWSFLVTSLLFARNTLPQSPTSWKWFPGILFVRNVFAPSTQWVCTVCTGYCYISTNINCGWNVVLKLVHRLPTLAQYLLMFAEIVRFYWVRVLAGSGICHRGCAFTVLQTMLSMVYCALIKKPWSHWIRVGHSPDFGLPSVAILPWLCRKRREAIFTYSPQVHDNITYKY